MPRKPPAVGGEVLATGSCGCRAATISGREVRRGVYYAKLPLQPESTASRTPHAVGPGRGYYAKAATRLLLAVLRHTPLGRGRTAPPTQPSPHPDGPTLPPSLSIPITLLPPSISPNSLFSTPLGLHVSLTPRISVSLLSLACVLPGRPSSPPPLQAKESTA